MNRRLLDALRGMVGLVQLVKERYPDFPVDNYRVLEAMSAIREAEATTRCATDGHAWVGIGAEGTKVVCDDCGIERVPVRLSGDELALWLKAWWVNNEGWREEMRQEFGMDIAQHMRSVADMIERVNTASEKQAPLPHNFDPERDVACTKGEYAQLVHNARRYEWLRDNMRVSWDDKMVTHVFQAPTSMSFQEAVDLAMEAANAANR